MRRRERGCVERGRRAATRRHEGAVEVGGKKKRTGRCCNAAVVSDPCYDAQRQRLEAACFMQEGDEGWDRGCVCVCVCDAARDDRICPTYIGVPARIISRTTISVEGANKDLAKSLLPIFSVER